MDSKILLGAVIGGIIGYFIGDHIASVVAPTYYTDEELDELLETNDKILEENEYHIKQIKPVKTIDDLRKEKAMGQKKDYTKYFKDGNKEPLEKLVKKYNEGEVEVGVDMAAGPDPLEEVEKELLLKGADEAIEEDFDEELDNRDKTKPYLLTREEWDDNDSGFEQVQLYFYGEDEVLTDTKNRPIQNAEKLLGEDALDNFGVFSNDDYIVYVCNPIKEVEYEVLLSEKAYSDVVLKAPKKTKPKNVAKKNVFEERDAGELEEVNETS